MSESTRKKVIAAVMLVAIIWGYQNLVPKKSEPVPDRPTPTAQARVQTAPINKPAVAPKLVNIEEKALEPWGEDPFRAAKTPAQSRKRAERSGWLLSGILYNDRSPVAIVNKKPVKVGETIDGAKVVKISRKVVTLEYNGNRMELSVTKG